MPSQYSNVEVMQPFSFLFSPSLSFCTVVTPFQKCVTDLSVCSPMEELRKVFEMLLIDFVIQNYCAVSLKFAPQCSFTSHIAYANSPSAVFCIRYTDNRSSQKEKLCLLPNGFLALRLLYTFRLMPCKTLIKYKARHRLQLKSVLSSVQLRYLVGGPLYMYCTSVYVIVYLPYSK